MKTIHLLQSATLLAFFTACNSGIDHSEEKAAAMPAQTLQQPAPSTPGTAAPGTGTTAALNPAHGQPGHNCDLPVGAPLNGAISSGQAQGSIAPITLPGTNGAPAQGAQPIQMTPVAPVQTAPAVGSSARLNPAHGQPGHDCNIAVGQPLRQ